MSIMPSSAALTVAVVVILGTFAASSAKTLGRQRPFVYPGEEVPDDTIRVTTLGSGSPDVRRHQV